MVVYQSYPRPWDSPGKNTGVGCHFLLQCIKVKSESEVAQSSPTLSHPMDCSLPDSSVHGVFQARVLEWVAIAFSILGDIITRAISHQFQVLKNNFCIFKNFCFFVYCSTMDLFLGNPFIPSTIKEVLYYLISTYYLHI